MKKVVKMVKEDDGFYEGLPTFPGWIVSGDYPYPYTMGIWETEHEVILLSILGNSKKSKNELMEAANEFGITGNLIHWGNVYAKIGGGLTVCKDTKWHKTIRRYLPEIDHCGGWC